MSETQQKPKTKVEITSAINEALKEYQDFALTIDKAGLDLTCVPALSNLCYALEDAGKFIASNC